MILMCFVDHVLAYIYFILLICNILKYKQIQAVWLRLEVDTLATNTF